MRHPSLANVSDALVSHMRGWRGHLCVGTPSKLRFLSLSGPPISAGEAGSYRF